MKPLQVGLLGFGTVGRGTWDVLRRNEEEIARRAGRPIRINWIATRTLDRARDGTRGVAGINLTNDPAVVVRHPDVDIVCELIGGTDAARTLVLDAIAHGKHVVTANKALLALHGNEIFAAASAKGVMVAFEAAVAGGVPIIKALREGLVTAAPDDLEEPWLDVILGRECRPRSADGGAPAPRCGRAARGRDPAAARSAARRRSCARRPGPGAR